MSRVHVIGGGFSGLSIAYCLSKLGVTVEVFEKTGRVGGLIGSERESWGLVESAANGLLNSEVVENLFADLNLQMAERPRARKRRYIYRGKPREWPLSFLETARFMTGLPLLFSSEIANAKSEETLRDWSSRLFGESAFNYLLGPAVQGIYGTTELDARLMVRQFNGAKGRRRKVRVRGTVAPVGGMGALVGAMAEKVRECGGEIHLNSEGDVRLSHPTVIATSAPAAALLLTSEAPEMARELMRIEYLPLTSVTVGVESSGYKYPGFGCLFPEREGFRSLGVLFNNCIFQGRSPQVSETWIFGEAWESENEVLSVLRGDRLKLYGKDENILASKVHSWPHAVPHYNSALRLAVDRIREIQRSRIYLTGNYLGLLGLAKILEFNWELAKKIKAEMA